MKKTNTILRVTLIVVILCTVFVIGSTLAKYITSDSGTDVVSVAKFGVNISSDNSQTFVSSYGDPTFYKLLSSSGDIFAPGTEGLMTLSYSGTPEVAIELGFNVVGAGYSADWKESGEVDAADYKPLVFNAKLYNGEEVEATISTNTTYALLCSDLESYKLQLAAGTDLSDYTIEICWAWAFEGNDAADTYISGLATAPTFELQVATSVTQIAAIGFN